MNTHRACAFGRPLRGFLLCVTGGTMAATRTPGITIGADGRFFIDKRYRGIRIGMRVGPVTQEQAEQRLRTEMHEVEMELARQEHRRPTFADCAMRYLAQSQDMRSVE